MEEIREERKDQKLEKILFIVAIIATFIRILIALRIPLSIYTTEKYDDQLLFQYAKSLSKGKWLGETYTDLTLVKGISFPIFLVLCNKLWIPYSFGVELFHIGAILVFLRAISVRHRHPIMQFIFYLLLLYSPVSLTRLLTQRVYRMAIIPSTVLLTFSCLIGLFLRREAQKQQLLCWSVASGVALAFCWYIREDSIWMLPFAAVITILEFLHLLWIQKEQWKKKCLRAACYLLPFLFLIAAGTGIRLLNRQYYGVTALNDRTGTSFAKVMSDLYSIEDPDAPKDVWVSETALQKAEEVSPALAQIREVLDADRMAWGQGGPVRGDHIAWVLRTAAQKCGIYKSARVADAYFDQVHRELTQAFEDGRLEKDDAIHFSSQGKGIKAGQIPYYLKETVRELWEMANYKETGLNATDVCTGSRIAIRQMERFLGGIGRYPKQTSCMVSGWAFCQKDEDKLQLYLVNERNEKLKEIGFADSPDVARIHSDCQNAGHARFQLQLDHIDARDVRLLVYINGKRIGEYQPQSCVQEKWMCNIDHFEFCRDTDGPGQGERSLYKACNAIVGVYQTVSPIVTVGAILAYLIDTGLVIAGMRARIWKDLELWLILTGMFLSAVVLGFGVIYFSSWFTEKMQQYISFYSAGAYYLLEVVRYLVLYVVIEAVFARKSKKQL